MKTDEAEAHISVKTMNICKKQLYLVTQHDMTTCPGSVMVFRFSIDLGTELY